VYKEPSCSDGLCVMCVCESESVYNELSGSDRLCVMCGCGFVCENERERVCIKSRPVVTVFVLFLCVYACVRERVKGAVPSDRLCVV